ncbi:KamA family radical SAM protein [Agrobacterium vitis]|uniref:KamA family radical SAM protein n=1 Tax=Agrobacterium vitis TaxID=373 RepID=UPI0012E88BC8|nr:radical SAM protein [Agrobacterium vitis]MVA63660.1 4Fe-4S cluster-binding domain-containing protein [Agrobacterium vitis]
MDLKTPATVQRESTRHIKEKLATAYSWDDGRQDQWNDWRWQQRNAIRTARDVAHLLPSIDIDGLERLLLRQKLLITPYFLELILRYAEENPHAAVNPLLVQVVPDGVEKSTTGFDHETENWENPAEMKTPICQHKYDNRVIIRASNVCNAYCQFCFEALRTLSTEKQDRKAALQGQYWRDTLEYLAATPCVEEIILSGGEPLMLSDQKLAGMLDDLRGTRPDAVIRLHTRALTFNPYRTTPSLVEALGRNSVGAVGLHVCHPAEISTEFLDAVGKLRSVVPLIFANIPLLGTVNDDAKTLEELCMTLYRNGILPYYLYHFMPFSPGSERFFVKVEKGCELMRGLKRRKSNLAVPEYVLPHLSGKYTVSIDDPSRPSAHYTHDTHGNPVFQFTNWRGERCDWANG